MNRPIHIAGANGFPIALYRPLMHRLSRELAVRMPFASETDIRASVCGTDVFGHIKHYPDWTGMVDHLVRSIEARRAGPVVGIGHSLGGALMGCAASQRPDLFHKLILIDSPYFSLPKRMVWAAGLCLPADFIRRIHPLVLMAAKKPDAWSSKEEAKSYFKSKKIFQKFDPEVLNIFLEECVVGNGSGGAQLLFPVREECDVYMKVPSEIRLFKTRKHFGMHEFPHKADFFFSKDHHIIEWHDIAWIKRFDNKNITFREYKGSHFWPFDNPDHCAATIAEHLLL